MAEETTRPEVRPFSIDVPEEELVDLRQRVVTARWPDKETVTDQSQVAHRSHR
jgi:epoxide hydrolase-like protein